MEAILSRPQCLNRRLCMFASVLSLVREAPHLLWCVGDIRASAATGRWSPWYPGGRGFERSRSGGLACESWVQFPYLIRHGIPRQRLEAIRLSIYHEGLIALKFDWGPNSTVLCSNSFSFFFLISDIWLQLTGTRPFAELMLTKIADAIWFH